MATLPFEVRPVRYRPCGELFADGLGSVLPEISTKGYTTSSEDIAKLVQLTRDTMLENIVEMGKLREARETA